MFKSCDTTKGNRDLGEAVFCGGETGICEVEASYSLESGQDLYLVTLQGGQRREEKNRLDRV